MVTVSPAVPTKPRGGQGDKGAIGRAAALDRMAAATMTAVAAGAAFKVQAAPAAKTTTTALTAAELLGGLITGNPGGSAAATYTLPAGSAIETAFLAAKPDLANNDSFDFSVINISTVAAETITIAAGGNTLVGDMTMACVAVGDTSSGMFRCRRTAANTYTIYRLS